MQNHPKPRTRGASSRRKARRPSPVERIAEALIAGDDRVLRQRIGRLQKIEAARALLGYGHGEAWLELSGFIQRLCQGGKVDHVRRILEAGGPVDVPVGVQRYTPLFQAVSDGNLALVELLVKHGADPRRTVQGGITPRSWAAQLKHRKVLLALRKPA